jgi:holo-[acyl-carrier protein] synthase
MHGIGADIVEISRVTKWINDKDALSLIYTERERACVTKPGRAAWDLAAAFAVKEAFMKALGTGWGDGVQWKDIEVINENKGISVRLYNRAKELCGDRRVFVSADCAGTLAVALVVVDDGA